MGDHVANCPTQTQMRYLKVLDREDRVGALRELLVRGGSSEDLIGFIQADGSHQPGLLEQSLGSRDEFVAACRDAGRAAVAQGDYRDALKLLHLGEAYGEVITVMIRAIRLPTGTTNLALIGSDIEALLEIYRRNVSQYNLPANQWNQLLKLMSLLHLRRQANESPDAAVATFETLGLLDHFHEDLQLEYVEILKLYLSLIGSLMNRPGYQMPILRQQVTKVSEWMAKYQISWAQVPNKWLASSRTCRCVEAGEKTDFLFLC